MDSVPVFCHFMFQRVAREEIDGGVRGVGFVEDAYFEVGLSSGYKEVKEVDVVCGFYCRT